ncbi:hypothetical protein VTO58DRAFT_107498 [Aureobasidium pullulans]
MAKGTTTYY